MSRLIRISIVVYMVVCSIGWLFGWVMKFLIGGRFSVWCLVLIEFWLRLRLCIFMW